MRTYVAKRRNAVIGTLALATSTLLFLAGCGANGSAASTEVATSVAGSDEDHRPAQDATDGKVSRIDIDSLTQKDVGRVLRIEGRVVRQCPAAGCWFQVKDKTGEVFIELSLSDIRLQQKRVGQEAEVTGRVVRRGGDLAIEAQVVEFESELE